MKKVFLIAVLGLFVSVSATTFAGSITTTSKSPVVQKDDDPVAKKADKSKDDKSCEKKCEKPCAKACTKKEEKKSEDSK